MNTVLDTLQVNGVEYVRKDTVQSLPTGPRHVCVVNSGWIFAGDLTEDDNDYVLSNATHVVRWESIGFAGMLKDPASSKVMLTPLCVPVKIPKASLIFKLPVASGWGK